MSTTVPNYSEGWTVPGYIEQRELSNGASGRVVEAIEEGTHRRVAIKYLSQELVLDPDFMARFRTQALKLKELAAASVVRVYDYSEQPGQSAALVMELVDGVPLRSMIDQQGPLDPRAAVTVLKGSLLGLAAVHRIGFGHRDVNPGNVLITDSGQVKLTDFGLTTPAAASPGYLAPERWEGHQARPASDVYAATATFYECLTGSPPFAGDPGRLQEQHLRGTAALDRIDPPLVPLIERGMAKDPSSRPHSANAFVSELEAMAASAYGSDWEQRGRGLLAVRAAAPRPLSAGGRQRPPGGPPAAPGGGSRRRRRLMIIASIAAAAAIALGLIVTAVTLSGGDRAANLRGAVSAGAPGLPAYSAVANVTPPAAASDCSRPTAFTYSATISAAAPGTVSYQWVYSSGQSGPVQVVSFTGAGNRVVTGETVKARRPGGGWAELKLLRPVSKTSGKATYKLLCGADRGGVTATAAVTPQTMTASCATTSPPVFTADGSITAAKKETVTYYWAQSGGKNSPPATLTFAKPGTRPVKPLKITPQLASGSGEAVLVVTSPVVAASGPATYTLSCLIRKARVPSPTNPVTSTALSATASVSPASESLTSCSAAAPTLTFSAMVTDSQAGTVVYHWRLPSGSGPARTLNFRHAGTQTVSAAYTPGSDSATGSGTLVISSPVAVSSNAAAFTVSCGQGLGITNDAPTIAQDGKSYSGTVHVSGGSSPYIWSVTGLPSGLTASGDGATLTISGDPQAAGTFTPRVSVHDSSTPALSGTTSFTLTVAGAAVSPLVISGYLASGLVGQGYSATLIGTGGDGTYNWAVTGLPPGLDAIPSGGTLTFSGTPTVSGSFPIVVSLSDGESPAQTAAANLVLVVTSPSPSPSSSPIPIPSPSPSSVPTPSITPSLSPSDGGSP